MSTAELLQQEGRQEGRQEGQISAQQKAVLEALEVRFEQIPVALAETIEGLKDSAKLKELLRAAIRSTDLEAFTKSL